MNSCLKMRLIDVLVFLCAWASLVISPVAAVCPTGCKCDDENLHVNCVDANLDIVPITLNPSVQRLILRSNKIRSIDSGTLTFYHELIHVDLSHNHLVRVQPGSFASQTKLLQLHLNANKISHLSNRTFGGPQSVMNSLAVLNLQNNLLDSIDPGVFTYTRNLEELDLCQNSIRELNTTAFIGLANLRTLKLDNNELTQVPKVFSAKSIIPLSVGNSNSNNNAAIIGSGGDIRASDSMVPHLAELSMASNPIEKIGNDAFSAAKNLLSLDLRGCKITTIEPNAFRGLGVLRRLILTDNNLMAVPTTSFPPMAQLEVLKLGRNPFDRLSKFAFGGLKKLKTLEISGASELSLVEPDAFSNLDLETVDLFSCGKLATLPPKLFKGLSGLRNLNLKDNALQDLPEDLVSWQSLRSLRLEGNPFRCVCELYWLRDLLLQEDKFQNTSSFVLCSEPRELKDRKLSTLSTQDLDCYLKGPIQKTILGVSIAVTVIILIVIFFLLYKYHEHLKNSCKMGFKRPSRRKHRSSVISSGKELDTATKTSFLSQSPYQFSDDDFQVRASLMSGSPGPGSCNGGGSGGYNIHPGTHTLCPVTMNSLNYPYSNTTNSYNNSHSLHHPSHHYKSTPNNYTSPNYTNEYDAPINSINYPHHLHNHHQQQQQHIDHNLPIHYPIHQHQSNLLKPIPITEL